MCVRILASLVIVIGICAETSAQRLDVPRRHDRPPGPPLTAEEAVQRMTVPLGFSVELVAAEPDVVNPVGMAIDERGRFWVTESFEYPRREPGPGRDRVKVLEDTTGDGKVDKVTVFAEGLNIPSGIAVGYGGVWVANAPDILFMQDTTGDGKADKIETVVTGFGRTDTHELPNSLTWGPDGWLYGLNGVFNYCDVKYAPENPNFHPDHPGWKFTCAMFRIHPRTREFQIFAEGTSNPWGIAFNGEGEAFISACVIDHLWHIVETGYYIRQGGPYPPHTWPMRSIVDHKHQKAAYCGITWFDSDAYPEEYRNVLYMGNIHGGCINADIAERNGSTFKGRPHPGFPPKPGAWDNDEYGTIRKTGDPNNPRLADFLTANDAWFMPVVQKVGPDGSLYILDWYDRYHCYQDANADPEGIDRSKGRLYRVRYQNTPHAQPFDLASKSTAELIELLSHPNVYFRETAQRLLAERGDPETQQQVFALALDRSATTELRLRGLWTAASMGTLKPEQLDQLLAGTATRQGTETPPLLLAWSLRLLGDQHVFSQPVYGTSQYANAPETLLQTIIAATKSKSRNLGLPTEIVCFAMRQHPDDQTLHHIGWNAIRSFLQEQPENVAGMLVQHIVTEQDFLPGGSRAYLNAIDLLYDHPRGTEALVTLLRAATSPAAPAEFQQRILAIVAQRLRQQGSNHERQVALRQQLSQQITPLMTSDQPYIVEQATTIAALWGNPEARQTLLAALYALNTPDARRIAILQTLIASGVTPEVVGAIQVAIASEETSNEFRKGVLDSLGAIRDEAAGAKISQLLVQHFMSWEPGLRAQAIEVLTQRSAWTAPLLHAIAEKKVEQETLNLNQLRRIAAFKNESLQKQFQAIYGTIREGRNQNREQVINFHRDFLNGTPGDPFKGIAVFNKVCAQCHKIYGEGADVGPDITRNGRNNWEQLLQNIFDPSAVIGRDYQARIVALEDGRILTGLPVEESEERIVLKIQGGKLETIPRTQIEAYKVSEVSMMPEDLEKQVTPQELADLFAFLALDRPPSDPEAKILSGAPAQKARE